MKAYVYIIYSLSLDKFYIGSTTYHPMERLAQHNQERYAKAFSAKGIPWTMFFNFSCKSNSQARKIENHLKAMKNKKYLLNLKKYPEMISNLKSKFT